MSSKYKKRMKHPGARLVRGSRYTSNQVEKNGEEYSGALKRLMSFKKQSRKRSDKNQAKFAWFEEDKRMKKEASKLWKDIEKYNDKFQARTVRNNNNNNNNNNTRKNYYVNKWEEMKNELNDEILTIKELVEECINKNINNTNGNDMNENELYEMAAILADYNTTQELVQNQIENEVNNLTEEIQAIRTTVYKSLRNNYEDTDDGNNNNSNDNNILIASAINGNQKVDIFQLVNNIKYVNLMDPSIVFDISQRLNTTYETFINDMKNLKINMNSFFIKHNKRNIDETEQQEQDTSLINRNEHNNHINYKKTKKKTTNIHTQTKDISANNTIITKPPSKKSFTIFLFNNWSNKAHNLFLKIYKETVARGKSKSTLYKRYQMSDTSFDMENGKKTLEEIQVHVQKYEKYKFIKNEMKEKKITWSRYLNEEINHFKSMCIENQKQMEINKQKQELIRLQNIKTSTLQSEFKRLKEIYDEKQKVVEAERMEKQRIQDEYDEMLRQKTEALYKKNKELTLVYQQEKQFKHQEYEMQLKKAQEEQEKARLEMLPYLKNRVNYRKKCVDEKNETRKEKMKLLIEEKERKEAILIELTKTCPYADKITSENLHDPERLFQATKAFEVAVAELDYMLANPMDGRLVKPLNGFNSKKIVKDIRFKLMEKLTRAGLQSAPYAQAMMIKMSRQGKVHQMSKNAPFREAPIVKFSAAQMMSSHKTFIY